jgi:hypothetical protein
MATHITLQIEESLIPFPVEKYDAKKATTQIPIIFSWNPEAKPKYIVDKDIKTKTSFPQIKE